MPLRHESLTYLPACVIWVFEPWCFLRVCEQIAERRQKRAAQLSEQQNLEMEEESIHQQQERDRLNEKLARQVESTTLKDSVKVMFTCLFCVHSFI